MISTSFHLRACIVALQLLANQTYYRETIDSIATSTHERVEVIGTVGPVDQRQDKAITFRLSDEHGHAIGCIWPPGKGEYPRPGVTVRVSGVRHYFDVPHLGHAVTEIEPVEKVEPVE